MRLLPISMAAIVALGAAAPASAAVTICPGGGCAPQPNSNVLMNKDMTGTTVTGTLNNAPGTVSFTSTEALINTAAGQANLEAVDGVLNSPLTISYSDGLISALEINLRAITAGNVVFSFSGGDSNGFVSGPMSLSKNGQNFFNLYDGTFDSVTLSFTDGATIENVRQVRLNSVAGAVPEPSTWAMMILGFGLVGGAVRRRNQQAKVTYA